MKREFREGDPVVHFTKFGVPGGFYRIPEEVLDLAGELKPVEVTKEHDGHQVLILATIADTDVVGAEFTVFVQASSGRRYYVLKSDIVAILPRPEPEPNAADAQPKTIVIDGISYKLVPESPSASPSGTAAPGVR